MSFTHGQAPNHISPPPVMNPGHPMTHPTQPPSALGGNTALMQSSAFVPPQWNVADLSNDISCFLAEAINLLDIQLIRAKEKKKMKEQERQRELARSRTFAQPQQRRHRSHRHRDSDGDGHRSLNASMSASHYNANRGLAQGAAPSQAPEYHRSRSMNAAHHYPQQPQYGQAYTYDYPQAAYQSQDYGGGNLAANPSMPQMNGGYYHQPQQPQPSAYNGRLAGAQSMYQLNDRNSTRSHRRHHHHDSSRSHYGSEYRSQRGGPAPSVYVTDDQHSMFTREFLTRGPIPRGARADVNIEPVNTRCPQCRQLVTTDIQKHIGTKNYAVTAAVAALGLIIKAPVTVMPLALTTYGLNFLKSKVHVCPECGYKMGKHVTISIPRGY